MQKCYCYTPGVGVCVGVNNGVHKMLGQMLKSICISSFILTLLIILMKPLSTQAFDRRASGDCGTSGYGPALIDCWHIVFVLFVFLPLISLSMHYNFFTLRLRERNFIFCMHTPLIMLFLMTPRSTILWPWLWLFSLKKAFSDFVAAGGIVFHKHIYFVFSDGL